jgi:cation:H+ antiporter
MTILNIFLIIFALIVGIIFLSKGADWLVDGSSQIAKKLGVSPLIIGLTIVAFGTSMPELVVSLTATLQNNPTIAIGNVIGSNIANILLILGLCGLIRPLKVKSSTIYKEIPLVAAASISVLFLGFSDYFRDFVNIGKIAPTGYLDFAQGIILLLFFAIFLYYNFGLANSSKQENAELIKETNDLLDNSPKLNTPKSIIFIIFGLILLIIGGYSTIYGATNLATLLGIPQSIISLTVVAIGTSLPELVTSIKATQKGEDEIAVGNVVGSNIFNIFFILGLCAIFGELKLQSFDIFDIIVSLGAAIILFISIIVIKKGQIYRIEGFSMLLIYFIYVASLFVTGRV